MSAVVSGIAARRARPLLGTLVEIGADDSHAIDAAFAAVAHVQARMSRFEATSDIGRFHALRAGESIDVDAETAEVLAVAAQLEAESDGVFDIALGSARKGWRIEGRRLMRLSQAVRLDLGGIAKGHAVDRAVAALQAQGCAAGYVNAGGDLRAFGAIEWPVVLRDELTGGVHPFCTLGDGALATSRYAGNASRSALWSCGVEGTARHGIERHVSVAAPLCLYADALTKLVAATGRIDHPLLATHGALAWLH